MDDRISRYVEKLTNEALGPARHGVHYQENTPRLIDIYKNGKPYQGPAIVSPSDAAVILSQANIGNRRIRNNLVLYLINEINSDEWQEDHPQPLVFSTERLIDGQHRLEAISKCNRSVVVAVVTGARDELREYLDTGITRTLEDRVIFIDNAHLNRLAAEIIKLAFQLYGHNRRPTPNEAMDYFYRHEKAIVFVAKLRRKKQVGISSVGPSLALMEFHERSSRLSELFADALYDPEGRIQQARRLREYLLMRPYKKQRGSPDIKDMYMKSIAAMKAYKDDRPINLLRPSLWNDSKETEEKMNMREVWRGRDEPRPRGKGKLQADV